MVTTLLLVSIAVSGFKKQPDIPETSVSAAEPKGISDFEWFMEEANESEVAGFLKTLQNFPKKASLPIKVDRYRKQIAIADRLIGMDTTELRRYLAIESKIKASSQFYGLDFIHDMKLPEATANLESIREYRDIDDDAIRREARLGIAKLSVYEFLKSKDPDRLQTAKDSIYNVVDSFPDSDYIVDNVRLLIQQMLRKTPAAGRETMKEFFDKYSDSGSKGVQDLAIELNDTLLLNAVNYRKLITNRWADGDEGKQRLLNTTLELIKNPKGGTRLLNQVSTTLSWFEQIHDFESARKIAEALFEAAQVHPVPEIATLTQRAGAGGIRRQSMVGERLHFRGQSLDGELKDEDYESRVVIVVFFVNDKLCTRALSNLVRLERELRNKGVALIGCCMEHDIGDTVKKVTKEYPKFRCIMADDSTPPTNEILQQYPVVATPHTILVDHKGIIRRINVQLADIRTHIDALLSARQKDIDGTNDGNP